MYSSNVEVYSIYLNPFGDYQEIKKNKREYCSSYFHWILIPSMNGECFCYLQGLSAKDDRSE